jgi:hypothetical protein
VKGWPESVETRLPKMRTVGRRRCQFAGKGRGQTVGKKRRQFAGKGKRQFAGKGRIVVKGRRQFAVLSVCWEAAEELERRREIGMYRSPG